LSLQFFSHVPTLFLLLCICFSFVLLLIFPQRLLSKRYNKDRIQSPEFMKHARDAAVQTIVLLKNQDNTLPLTGARLHKVAVLGPGGNTRGHPTYGPGVTSNATTVFTALESRLGATGVVVFAQGCDTTACDTYNKSSVSEALVGATSAVVVLSGTGLENEGG
jgi:beta-glucosidase